MEWMLMPYWRYAEFSGRSRRMEYWMFALFQTIVTVVFYALLFAGMELTDANGQIVQAPGMIFYVVVLLLVVFGFGSLIPALAVAVRRLHDTDRSGWWLLIYLVPFVGPIVLLVFFCIDGTAGPNRFGPDQLGRVDAEVFA